MDPLTTTVEVLDEQGAVEWTGSLDTFLASNELDDDTTWELLATLRDGEAYMFGGGAAPVTNVRVKT